MTTAAGPVTEPGPQRDRPVTLVWIDAREALIVRWRGDAGDVERLESEVPAHHRSTGHVRHDPRIRLGGGGRPQTAGEPHRIEHLDRFVEEVARHLPSDEDLVVIGPGTVREHLARHVREADRRHGLERLVDCRASRRLTDRQLVARLRRLRGDEPRRHTVGAYRWTERTETGGAGGDMPRRVVAKRTPDRDR